MTLIYIGFSIFLKIPKVNAKGIYNLKKYMIKIKIFNL